jgi:hypothetical protein
MTVTQISYSSHQWQYPWAELCSDTFATADNITGKLILTSKCGVITTLTERKWIHHATVPKVIKRISFVSNINVTLLTAQVICSVDFLCAKQK